MQLILVRHGEAVEDKIDPRRPLSAEGVAQVIRVASVLKKSGVVVEEFIHSSKERARQTADIIRHTVNPKAPMSERNFLAPMESVDRMADEIRNMTKTTLVAGHMPFLGYLVSRLVAGEDNKDLVRFIPATLALLDRVGGESWIITTVISPEIL